MRLFLIGADVDDDDDDDDYPELLPNEVRELIIAAPAAEPVYLWATSMGIPVTVVTEDAKNVPDAILDEISELIENPRPDDYVTAMAEDTDVVFMGWDGSTRRYRQLRALNDRGVGVLDLKDGFQELVIEGTPDIDQLVAQITTRVTSEVLKVVRAEMQETARPRRRRNAVTAKGNG